jgi:hypothetical protein
MRLLSLLSMPLYPNMHNYMRHSMATAKNVAAAAP